MSGVSLKTTALFSYHMKGRGPRPIIVAVGALAAVLDQSSNRPVAPLSA